DVGSNDVRILFGDGAGGLLSSAILPAGFAPVAVAADRADADALLDLVVVNQAGANAVIYKGDGVGGFVPIAGLAPYGLPSDVALGDLDGNGSPDLVVSNEGSSNVGLFGDGLPGFPGIGRFATGSLPTALALADVDGDGKTDLLTADSGSNTVTVLRNRTPCGGSVTAYGVGCPGSGGFVPSIDLQGCPAPGALVTLEVSGGFGGSSALVLFGLNQASIPRDNGCFLLVSPILPLMFTLPLSPGGPGAGAVALTGMVPASFPGGSNLTAQAFVGDPGPPQGFSTTAGIDVAFE
ncbi:MAG: FG-GAP repeat domain-containing protein, partial [Planctomycetota bacterium JB042]